MVKKYFHIFIVLSCLTVFSCGIDDALKQEYLDEGIWRGIIKAQGQEIPFNFEVIREDSVTYDLNIMNGAERVNIKGLAMQGDSVFIPIYIFDTGIKAKLDGNKMVGVFEKNYEEKSRLPFEATFNKTFRFPDKEAAKVNVQGKWEVTFVDQNETVHAVGIFKQKADKVEGTFLTSLGDFRYLEGIVEGHTLLLSTFDGANAFLFKADVLNPKEMKGHFWSGAFKYQTWHAVKNDLAEVPLETSTKLIDDPQTTFNFNLTDLNGKMVSLSEAKYANKIKVIHLFGTWSSNSIDQMRFLADWHKKNKGLEVSVIGLAFEQKDDFTYAKNRINKIANKLNAQYDFLVAGTADKVASSEKFPMLKSIETFPTTLILDRNNKIRKMYTGFLGPGSGAYHDTYVENFNAVVDALRLEGKDNGLLVKGN